MHILFFKQILTYPISFIGKQIRKAYFVDGTFYSKIRDADDIRVV